MAQRIHYTQNCLYLYSLIKTVDEALHLKLNGELFFEKILDDIFFVEEKLDVNYRSLLENTNLIRRVEHFKAVLNTKLALIQLLERILELPIEHYFEVHPFRERFRHSIEKNRSDAADIRTVVSTEYSEPEEEDVVSEAEISLLLQEEE